MWTEALYHDPHRLQIHGIQWDPYCVNEFVSTGSNSALLFWMLDETGVWPVHGILHN